MESEDNTKKKLRKSYDKSTSRYTGIGKGHELVFGQGHVQGKVQVQVNV